MLVRMARRLQTRGVAGLRVDLYASGVSDGSFHTVTLLQELEQVLYLMKEVRRQQLWQGPLILLGFSEAAKLAVEAARRSGDAAGLCLWNGMVAPEPWAAEQKLRRLHRVEGHLVFDMGYGVWVNRAVVKEAQQLTISCAESLPGVPVLGVFGGADEMTRASRTMLERAGHPTVIIPGADHLFTSTEWEAAAMAATEQWVCERFV